MPKITKVSTTTKSSMPQLLSELAAKAYEQPVIPTEERDQLVHKLWEEQTKLLDRSQLKVACINYNHICKQISSSLNQTA